MRGERRKKRTKSYFGEKVFQRVLTTEGGYGLICIAVLIFEFCIAKLWGRLRGNQYRRKAAKPSPEEQPDAEGAG